MATASKSINFTWKLSSEQRKLFESDARFRTAMMGRRFGKNEVGTAVAVDYATQPHAYDFGADSSPVIWWVAPTYRQAYLYGYEKTLEKLPDILVDEDDTRGSEWSPSKIQLTEAAGGATIEFLSYNNPKGLQGAGVDLIVGDEWAYSERQIWDQDLRPMLMDSGGGAVLISKPLGENHFYDHYLAGAGPDMPYSDGEPALEGHESFHATAYDNPFIPDSEVDASKRTTPESVFRQEYLADPQSGGTLLTLDMLDYASWRAIESGGPWRWHVAVDIGVTMSAKKARENDDDYWAAAIVAEHERKPEAYLLQVLRRRGQTPAEAATWIDGVVAQLPTNRVYYEAVQAQRWLAQELQDVGLQAVPVDQSRAKEERITFLSVPFSNGNVKLIDWDGARGEDHEPHPHNEFDWSDFRTEWAGFPNAAHDDQLDATEMALRQCNLGAAMEMYGADPYQETDG